MFTPGVLTFQEFAMHEPLPLATIQEAVLEFLRGREDVAVFGAQAVNAYVYEPRMTQVNLLSPRAEELAEEIQDYLHTRFRIAARVRKVADGRGFRIYQARKEGDRHLVDLQLVDALPETQNIANILVLSPMALLVYKLIAYTQRQGNPKAGTDWRDIAMLLLTFPELKLNPEPVIARLHQARAGERVFEVWDEFVAQEFRAEDDEY